MSSSQQGEVLVIGAGAAGLSCAARIGPRARVLEHNAKPGLKVLISGGGRCNFTNRHCDHDNFVSGNPHFPRNALARWTSDDTVAWVEDAGIAWHEKHRGQLFCDLSSKDILNRLLDDCTEAGATLTLDCPVEDIRATPNGFEVVTANGIRSARAVVLACGGLSFPKLGVSDLGYRVAAAFGHAIQEPVPSLVGLTWPRDLNENGPLLTGVSLPVRASVNGITFEEDLLFTHAGLSGPAILQVSNYWNPGDALHLDLLPHDDLEALLTDETRRERSLVNVLSEHLPRRLAGWIVKQLDLGERKLKQLQHPDRQNLRDRLKDWSVIPGDTTGWEKAEVTRGGVSVDEIDPRTFESRLQPGLYVIGELLDVTGWLGGYNLQWAFASGRCCGDALS